MSRIADAVKLRATVARHRALDHLRRQRARPQTTGGDWLTEVADLADTWVSASPLQSGEQTGSECCPKALRWSTRTNERQR